MLYQEERNNGEIGEVRNASDEEKLELHDTKVDKCIESSFKEYDMLYKLLT